MKAGLLRHRVDLQSRVDVTDEIGQPSTSWLTTAMLWADIRHLTGLSAIKSGADTSVTKVSIRCRHRPFNAGQRIVHEGQVFDVKSVLPDGKKQFVDLLCETINAQVS